MADRYSKNNILEYPVLAPERHYESENPPLQERPSVQIVTPDPLLENLEDLENVYKLANLLPPDLAKIIREITDVLSKHTQGLIIMRLQRQLNPTVPESPETPTPTPGPGGKKTEPGGPGTIDRPKEEPTTSDSGGREKKPTTPWSPSHTDINHGGEVWPQKKDEYGPGDSSSSGGTSYISSGDDNTTFSTVISNSESYSTIDAETDDIFSTEPDVEITIGSQVSLIDLARAAYEQDDADIKEHYTSMMSQITQRFFQVMTALAEDSNMLDYSDLMQDFDGTAVTTSDPNQQHLIDEICKNDILYDQALRQMNLTHTAAKTLVMTRGMTAAEGERERYLSEEYKTNIPSIVAGLSNDLLQKNREEAQKKYKEAAYNYYKYLDSATKATNAMLNMKIDSAAAKGQLANTGSNIFAYTPPPQPLPDDVDDNYDTVMEYDKKENEFLKDQAKDQKKASEIDSGTSGPSSLKGNFKVKGGKGNTIANTGDAGEGQVRTAIMISGMTGIKSEFILAQMIQECGWGDDAGGAVYHNYGGLKAGDIGYGEWGDVGRGGHTIFPDDETYAKTWVSKVIAIQDHCDELAKLSEQGDVVGYVTILRDSGYFAPESYDNYVKNMTSIIRTLQGD